MNNMESVVPKLKNLEIKVITVDLSLKTSRQKLCFISIKSIMHSLLIFKSLQTTIFLVQNRIQ